MAAKGSFDHDPNRTRRDLEPIGELTVDPPSDLELTEREAHFWRRVVPLIPQELRAGSDTFAVAMLCRLLARSLSGGKPPIAAEASTTLSYLGALGLTEQGRRKLALPGKKPEKSEKNPNAELAEKIRRRGMSQRADPVATN